MALEIITLTDPRTGSTARLLPGFGMNCYQFQALTDDGPLEVIWSEPGFATGDRRAAGSGIPLLFPFPGRIAGTVLQWAGHTYSLPAGDGLGNAIHGFVLDRPWRVLRQEGAELEAQFQASIDAPELLACWPADFQITAHYAVTGHQLQAWYRCQNPDRQALPCGLGTHPYFRLPLGGARAGDCCVQLPVAANWTLDNMNATGEKRLLPDAARFQQGLPFADMTFDNVFGDLQFAGDRCEASIHDPSSGRQVVQAMDRTFRECVVYTPPHREAICIEPYTCVPDPFRLAAQQVDAGLRVLEPGQTFTAHVEIRVG